MDLNQDIEQVKQFLLKDSYKFFILIGSTSFLIFFPDFVISGPSDFYKKQKECTWENAKYYSAKNRERYCVQKNGLIQSISVNGITYDLPGSANKQVKIINGNISTILEWKIESKELIRYSCKGDDSKDNYDCYESPIREVYGLDRGSNKQSYIQEGKSLYNSKMFKEAIFVFSDVIELDKKNSYAYQMRGKSYFALGRFNMGTIDMNKAVSLSKNYIEGYKYLAIDKLLNKDYFGGINILDRAIEINASDASLFLYRGILKSSSGDSSGAKLDFDKAIDVNSKYKLTYLYRSLLNSSLSKVDNSLKDLKNYSGINFEEINNKCFIRKSRVKESGGFAWISLDYLKLMEVIITQSNNGYSQILYSKEGLVKDDKLELFNGRIITITPEKNIMEMRFEKYYYPIKDKDGFFSQCNNVISTM